MSEQNTNLRLPAYQAFEDNISILNLPISGSELHGVICGYLCAGAGTEGESYVRSLMQHFKKSEATRQAAIAMFEIFSISQQQMMHFDFDFQLLLPDDHLSLQDRAKAFSEWCEGFMQGLSVSGIELEDFLDEESQEALQHLQEFAELDYENLDIGEEDEIALMEVSEYARLAVLRLYGELHPLAKAKVKSKTRDKNKSH